MSTDFYQIAYDHAIDEIAEINAQIQRLIHRKELLAKLREPLNLLVSESSSMPAYQLAYQQATREISEIDPQIQRLSERKELLEELLEPLELLVSESGAVAISTANGSRTEFSSRSEDEAVVVLVNVPELRPDTGEDPDPTTESDLLTLPLDRRTNGRAISDDDVAELAYRFWSEGGRLHGRHEDDWFRAAHELHNLV